MNQTWIIGGVAVAVALALAGYFLLLEPEPSPPVTARVEVPETPAPRPAPETAPAPEPEPPAATAEPPEPEPPAATAEPSQVMEPAPAAEPETAESETDREGAGAAPSEPPAPRSPQVVARPAAPEAASAQQEESAAEPPSPVPAAPPSFDVVRVEKSGEAVIAGQAAPGSVVTLLAGTRRLGQVSADSRGQWVLVLEAPLAPGSHELSLEARTAEGQVLLSENVVVVSVPRPQVAAAQPAPREAEPPAAQPAPARPAAEPAAPTPEPEPAQAATAEPEPEPVQAPTPEPSRPREEAAPDQPVVPSPETAPAEQPSAAEQVAASEPSRPTREPQGAAPADQGAGVARVRPETEQPLAVLMPRGGEGPVRVLQQPESPRRGLGEGALVLETVDYDTSGRATVGGGAEPGAQLIVYLDETPVAYASAGVDGRWAATLERRVAPGLHRVRVDQLGDAGQVVARVEIPFSRAAVVAALPEEAAVIVQPGNSLWRIARRVYGKGVRYSVIYQANQDQIRDPDLIYPGQIFVLPSTN